MLDGNDAEFGTNGGTILENKNETIVLSKTNIGDYQVLDEYSEINEDINEMFVSQKEKSSRSKRKSFTCDALFIMSFNEAMKQRLGGLDIFLQEFVSLRSSFSSKAMFITAMLGEMKQSFRGDRAFDILFKILSRLTLIGSNKIKGNLGYYFAK